MCFLKDDLIAICPAHSIGDQLRSHWGLTYGGWIFREDVDKDLVIQLYKQLRVFLGEKGFKSLWIKEVPEFYMNEKARALNKEFTRNGRIVKTERVFAIDYSRPLQIHKTKRKRYRKASDIGYEIAATSDFSEFWNEALIPRLRDKHGVKPVHSLDEINSLASQFPEKILQYSIRLNNELLAGVTVFDKGSVVKSQYGATTEKGAACGALDILFLHLIYKYQNEGKAFFLMVTVGDTRFDEGFNPGLKKQKEELGCHEYRQHFYTFDLT
jgi:hypothetical protein